MGIAVELWRARIGLYSGPNSSNSRSANDQRTVGVKYAFFIAYLLLIGGVEPNPGPVTLEDLFKLVTETKNTMEESLKEVKNTITTLEKSLKEQLNDQNKTIEELKQENISLKVALQKLEIKQDDLENRSRRENLIFHGIEEGGENETWADCRQKIIGMTQELMGVNVMETDNARAHRLGHRRGMRPIIVKFSQYALKEKILEARASLKGTDIFVSEDFSLKVRRERGFLLEQMKAAREKGMRATVSYNKLRVNGRLYKYSWDEEKIVEITNTKHDLDTEKVTPGGEVDITNERRTTRQESRKIRNEEESQADNKNSERGLNCWLQGSQRGGGGSISYRGRGGRGGSR